MSAASGHEGPVWSKNKLLSGTHKELVIAHNQCVMSRSLSLTNQKTGWPGQRQN